MNTQRICEEKNVYLYLKIPLQQTNLLEVRCGTQHTENA